MSEDDRTARALLGNVLGDDGLPDPELVAILARDVARALDRPELAADAKVATDALNKRDRAAALARLTRSRVLLDALIQTPTGPLTESLPGRVY